VSSSEFGVELVPQGDYRSAKKTALTSKTTTSDMIAEPTPQGDGYSGRGMKKTPKLDTIVMSSYRQKPGSNSDLPDAGPPTIDTAKGRATPSRPREQAPTSPTSKQQAKPSPVVMANYKQKTSSEVPPADKDSTPNKTKGMLHCFYTSTFRQLTSVP